MKQFKCCSLPYNPPSGSSDSITKSPPGACLRMDRMDGWDRRFFFSFQDIGNTILKYRFKSCPHKFLVGFEFGRAGVSMQKINITLNAVVFCLILEGDVKINFYREAFLRRYLKFRLFSVDSFLKGISFNKIEADFLFWRKL